MERNTYEEAKVHQRAIVCERAESSQSELCGENELNYYHLEESRVPIESNSLKVQDAGRSQRQ